MSVPLNDGASILTGATLNDHDILVYLGTASLKDQYVTSGLYVPCRWRLLDLVTDDLQLAIEDDRDHALAPQGAHGPDRLGRGVGSGQGGRSAGSDALRSTERGTG